MAAGTVNTLRQVGTATGVAVLGAIYASRVTASTLHTLAGLPIATGSARRLASAVGSGAGTRIADTVPPASRAAIIHAARAGTASGLNDVLRTAAAIAILGAIAAAAFIRDQPTNSQPPASPAPAPAPSPSPPQIRHHPAPSMSTSSARPLCSAP
ncbi:MAG TPA: hypothetical protein VMV92_22160 [Streptosporangiaceae bacterium]|nr:hypothetical protein [Streptosporangiaceae bacterium]